MPKIVDHAQRRREIVTAVWSIVARHGLEGVTLRAVAAEAGISAGRVQHYYATRADLVRDGCRLMVEGAREHFFAQVAALPPLEALRTLLHRTVPTTESWTVGTIVWSAYHAKSVDDPEIAALVARAHTEGVRQAARFVEAARRDGVLAPGPDPERVALRLLATSEGYAARVMVGSLTADDALRALDQDLDDLRPARP